MCVGKLAVFLRSHVIVLLGEICVIHEKFAFFFHICRGAVSGYNVIGHGTSALKIVNLIETPCKICPCFRHNITVIVFFHNFLEGPGRHPVYSRFHISYTQIIICPRPDIGIRCLEPVGKYIQRRRSFTGKYIKLSLVKITEFLHEQSRLGNLGVFKFVQYELV